MTFKTLASATLLFMLSPLSLASAQSPTDLETVVFETVDSYDAAAGGLLSVTGIVQGEATPRTIVFAVYYPSMDHAALGHTCERLALMAMTKPGQYLFQVRYSDGNGAAACRLTRR